LFDAPRTLNDPVFCRFSSLRKVSRPHSRVNVALRLMGVALITGAIRSRAALMWSMETTASLTGSPFSALLFHHRKVRMGNRAPGKSSVRSELQPA
jgi:hypothetical protein